MTSFSIDVPPGPVQGIVTQAGQRIDKWEDVDLDQPWFWAPPQPTDPNPPGDTSWAGWTEIGYTVED
jgi:hypothetical protein